MKKGNQEIEMIDVAKPMTLPELGSPVAEAMKKVRKAMCAISSFDNNDFRELVDERELMHEGLR